MFTESKVMEKEKGKNNQNSNQEHWLYINSRKIRVINAVKSAL